MRRTQAMNIYEDKLDIWYAQGLPISLV